MSVPPFVPLQWPSFVPMAPPLTVRPPLRKKPRSKKLTRFYKDPIVHIKAGPEKQDFGIHRSLLVNASVYFKNALNGPYVEAATNEISFDDMNPKIIECFASWLYQGSINESLLEELLPKQPDRVTHLQDCRDILIEVYAFADSRMIYALQNHVIDKLAAMMSQRQDAAKLLPKGIQKAYGMVPADSSLMKLFIQRTAALRSAVWLAVRVEKGQIPTKVLVEILRAMHCLLQPYGAVHYAMTTNEISNLYVHGDDKDTTGPQS